MKPSQHQGGTHKCPFKIEGENATGSMDAGNLLTKIGIIKM